MAFHQIWTFFTGLKLVAVAQHVIGHVSKCDIATSTKHNFELIILKTRVIGLGVEMSLPFLPSYQLISVDLLAPKLADQPATNA